MNESLVGLFNMGYSAKQISEKLGMTIAQVYIDIRQLKKELPWYQKICVVCGGKRASATIFCIKHRNKYQTTR